DIDLCVIDITQVQPGRMPDKGGVHDVGITRHISQVDAITATAGRVVGKGGVGQAEGTATGQVHVQCAAVALCAVIDEAAPGNIELVGNIRDGRIDGESTTVQGSRIPLKMRAVKLDCAIGLRIEVDENGAAGYRRTVTHHHSFEAQAGVSNDGATVTGNRHGRTIFQNQVVQRCW